MADITGKHAWRFEVNDPRAYDEWRYLWAFGEAELAATRELRDKLNRINAPVRVRIVANSQGESTMSSEKALPMVLVADDDEDDRNFIRKAWAKGRAVNQLRFVEDGEELTDYLNHKGNYSDPASAPRPGVILLDLNMPRKDGREALEEIKANPELRRIPIVVLTT